MSKIGIVIGNLGTPSAPTISAVRKYLKQFLMDPEVIDKPYWFRWLLVYGIILPFRTKKSTHAYQTIWTKEGSPLLVLSQKLQRSLQKSLGDNYKVVLGMRYGEPSIEQAFAQVKDCEKIILFPQYPQYADSSYKTWMDEAHLAIQQLGLEKKVTTIEPFYAQEEYLQALTNSVHQQLVGKDYELLLMSYHGLPERHVRRHDVSGEHCTVKPDCCAKICEWNKLCYRAQCFAVSRELAQRLNRANYLVTFQSRLGRDPWIKPYTDQEVVKLAQKGIRKIAVVMPAFTVDCLETLEEVHIRLQEDFKAAGGEEFYPLSCLNDDPYWVEQLVKIIRKT